VQLPRQRILAILEKYVSSVNAQVMLNRAMRDSDVTSEPMSAIEARRVCDSLRRGIDLFVDARHHADITTMLGQLTNDRRGTIAPKSIELRAEPDISSALQEARRMCEACSASSFAMQKVTTIVSELARNVVSYTPGGRIELTPMGTARVSIEICAIDTGKGIPDLDLVLSGRYKSRTGMGRGLLGCKRLADGFNADTGPRGTTIRAQVSL
jgi:serine/threonine-protein kinase RsbT